MEYYVRFGGAELIKIAWVAKEIKFYLNWKIANFPLTLNGDIY